MMLRIFSRKMMILCVAIVAMSMTMVSCSENDENGAPSSEEYKIEVGEGMTLPVNEFLKVPAVAGDQNVINALKSIDKLRTALPESLQWLHDQGYAFKIFAQP